MAKFHRNNQIRGNPIPKKGLGVSIYPVGLLILVGCIQIWLANFHFLSPWKGGGFGMFAVADAPGQRFLTFEALGHDYQPMLIDAEKYWSPDKRKFLKSMPDQRALEQLADELMQESFVPVGNKMSLALQNFKQQHPEAFFPEMGSDHGPEETVYRVREAADGPEMLAQAQKLKALHVRMWRTVFIPERNSLFAQPMLEPAIRREMKP